MLTRGALAEMRTLLMELRPEAITRSNMEDLLRQLGRALTGRTGVPNILSERRPEIASALSRTCSALRRLRAPRL